MDDLYLWLKALHIIAVIAWMAGLLYLPRLFVYHSETEVGSAQSETFKVMERRLLRGIMTPALVAVWILGLLLAWDRNCWMAGWFHGKLALVVAISVVHHLLAIWRREFEADRNRHSAKFFRIWNEVPTVAMIGIVILVMFKPNW